MSWPMAFLIAVLSLIGLYAFKLCLHYLALKKLLKEIKDDEDFNVWSDEE